MGLSRLLTHLSAPIIAHFACRIKFDHHIRRLVISFLIFFQFAIDADPLAFQDAFRPRRYRQVPQVLQVRVRRRRARSRWHEMAQAVLQMR